MKTWTDIEAAARTDPTLHRAVTLVQRGDLTREQALILAALRLAETNRHLHARVLALLHTMPVSPVVWTDPAK